MKKLDNYREVRGLLALALSAGIALIPNPNGNVMDIPKQIMINDIDDETKEKVKGNKNSKARQLKLEKGQKHLHGLNIYSTAKNRDHKYTNKTVLNEAPQKALKYEAGKEKALQKAKRKMMKRAMH
jgi:hypothetical protein